MEKQKCPEVRFNQFNGSWFEKNLSNEVSFYSGLTYSPNDITNKNGTLVLRSSNVQNGEISLLDNVYVRSEVAYSQNVDEGDIIVVVRNGSRSLIGKHATIKNKMINTVIGAFMTGVKSSQPDFINALFDSNNFTNQVNRNLGATINQITIGAFKEMNFYFPQEEEKVQIGEFFQNLDQSIALHEKKLIQTQNFKKAMLEKMFPKHGSQCPEIRLKGFSGDWKRFKLGDIASIVDRKDSASTAPIMMISAASGFINQSEKYSSNNAGQSLAKYTVLQKGELAYNHGASKHKPYGACFALEVDEARIPFVYHCFNVGENNPYFTAIALNHFRIDGQLRKLISSGARMDGLLNISFDAYKTVEVMLPNKEEQDEIHNFFKSLDETLTLQQQKLRTLKNLKQALLEKMFV